MVLIRRVHRFRRGLGAAAVAVGCLAVVAVAAQRSDAERRVVRVTAERFEFTPSQITVPMGTTIEFQLKSLDTSHGFRIIGQSIDLTIPKRGRGEANVTFTPPEPGTYIFECSRLCGAGHSFMRGTIHVRPPTSQGATGAAGAVKGKALVAGGRP